MFFLYTLLGFVLIIVDLVLVPGLVLLILGSGLILYSVYLNYLDYGLISALIHLLVCLAVVPYLVRKSLARIALKKEMSAEDGYLGLPVRKHYVGMEGVAFTDLRPSGTIQIEKEGRRELLDCISEGGFLEKGTAVKILAERGPSLVVGRIS